MNASFRPTHYMSEKKFVKPIKGLNTVTILKIALKFNVIVDFSMKTIKINVVYKWRKPSERHILGIAKLYKMIAICNL